MHRHEIVQQLSRAPVLRRLPAGDLDRLLSRSQLSDFPPGAALIAEGERGDKVFVLTRGNVAIRLGLSDDEQRVVAIRGAGDWVGELAIADDRPRSASVIAQEDVSAVVIPRDAFLEVVGGFPAAALDLVRVVSARLRQSDAARLAAMREKNRDLSSSNQALRAENLRLRAAREGGALADFLGASVTVERVRAAAARAAASDLPVLLLGETGTGKELVARGIHADGRGNGRPAVAINCALLRESLMHAELFGYARGAFTGAVAAKPGLVEEADGATLFLDEVADMPLSIQAALLRFLELGEFRRLGETRVRHASTRVIAATSVDIDAAASSGALRRDLLFRLDVFRINLPALREHPEDLPELLSRFSARVAERVGGPPLRFGPDALDCLAGYAFPGNVRELQNEIERLYATLGPGAQITEKDLSPRIVRAQPGSRLPILSYQEALRSFKADLVRTALERAGGNRTHAALELGVHRANLVRMIRDLEIASP
jgi:DNA-binding NtrC family response regulator